MSTGAIEFHGGWPIPEDKILNSLISLCVAINFICTWINILDKNIAWSCLSYQYNIKFF